MTVNDFRPEFFFEDPRSVSLRSLCGRVGNVSVYIGYFIVESSGAS